MKKITVFLWCSVFLCSIMTHAQSSEIPTHLVVKSNNGDAVSFLLSDKPKITFPYDDKNRLRITSLNGVYEFECHNLTDISYASRTSGISIGSIKDEMVEQQGDQLYFSTNKSNTHISIADIKGNIIMSVTIDSGNYFFPLSDLLPGTYIAKINNTTIKFIKQ